MHTCLSPEAEAADNAVKVEAAKAIVTMAEAMITMANIMKNAGIKINNPEASQIRAALGQTKHAWSLLRAAPCERTPN